MIITCKACNTSFNLNERLLKPGGSKVRCSKCKEIFMAYPVVPLKEAEKPDEIISDLELKQVSKDSETGQLDNSGLGELDFPDMDKLFSEEDIPEKEDDFDEAIEDLKLNFDYSPEPEKTSEDIEEKTKFGEPEKLDLSNIEELLDLEKPETEGKDKPDQVELDFHMVAEPEIEKVSEDFEVSFESEELAEVDLSDVEKIFEFEEEKTEETAESVDLALLEKTSGTKLDEIEEKADKPEAVESSETEEIEREFAIEDTDQDDLSEEEIADVQPVVAKAKSPTKKRVSKPLIVLLILVLLGGGCYGIYVALNFMNIRIPFVSDYFEPKILDPAGNIKIDTFDIDSTFVKNTKAGRLFVITGRIKNGYSDDRSFIRVTGKLYTKGKILVQKKTVFCGNVLSDIELSNLELATIKKRLLNRLGDNKSNIRVKPGQELPFMIVFGNLPADLEEFAIEAEGSAPG
ncbi:MAG: hypothetical protein DRH24_04085 [Deltaproteobacteria bacterium]|nr:MAG: hypothetical protein DRH24_04085 [Deltaproteobacteria bacterium]